MPQPAATATPLRLASSPAGGAGGSVAYAAAAAAAITTGASIDSEIAMADSALARGNIRVSFFRYIASLRLIADALMRDTTFQDARPPGEQQRSAVSPSSSTSEALSAPPSPPTPPPFKNMVVGRPDDFQRLFGLAHLCLTEVEDIVNGEVNLDDLEADDDDDEDDEESAWEEEHFIKSMLAGNCPTCSSASAMSKTGGHRRRVSETSSVRSPLTSPLSRTVGFRQTRLSRPRSIRSTVRSSVRLSSIIMANVIESSSPSRKASLSEISETAESARASPAFSSATDDAGGGGLALQDLPDPDSRRHYPGKDSPEQQEELGLHPPPPPPQGTRVGPPDSHRRPANILHETIVEEPEYIERGTSENDTRSNLEPDHAQSLAASQASLADPPVVTMPRDYIPMIPMSPLLHRRTQLLSTYTSLSQQLQQLQASASLTPSGVTLQKLRKLLEDVAIVKSRLSAATSALGAASTKTTVTEFTPRQLAVTLTLLDWDIFSGRLEARDLAGFAQMAAANGRSSVPVDAMPVALRALLDQSIFYFRLVQATVVSSEPNGQVVQERPDMGSNSVTSAPPPPRPQQTAAGRARLLTHWIQVAEVLFALRSYNALAAVVEALCHQLVGRLDDAWQLVPRRLAARLDDLRLAVSPLDDYRMYRGLVARDSRASAPPHAASGGVSGSGGGGATAAAAEFPGLIPIVHVLLEDASRCGANGPAYFTALLSQWHLWSCSGGDAAQQPPPPPPPPTTPLGGAAAAVVAAATRGHLGVVAPASKAAAKAAAAAARTGGYASERRERSDDAAHWVLSQVYASDERLLALSLAAQPPTASGSAIPTGGGSRRPRRVLRAGPLAPGGSGSSGGSVLERLRRAGARLGRAAPRSTQPGAAAVDIDLPTLRAPGAFPLGYCGGDAVRYSVQPHPQLPQPGAATTGLGSDDGGVDDVPSLAARLRRLANGPPPASPTPHPGVVSASASAAGASTRPPSPTESLVESFVAADARRSTQSLILEALPLPPPPPPMSTGAAGAGLGYGYADGEDNAGEEGGELAAALAEAEEEAAIQREFDELVGRLERLKREMM